MCCVSPQYGMVYYESVIGTWNAVRFKNFMLQLTRRNAFTQQRSMYFIVDGVRFHNSDIVKEVLRGLPIKHELVVLPPYSPHLNVIEYCFHVWKSEVKRTNQLATTKPLSKQIEEAALLITPDYVNRCMDHVMQVYMHCVEGKPLGEFVSLDKKGRPKALVDREERKTTQEEQKKS